MNAKDEKFNNEDCKSNSYKGKGNKRNGKRSKGRRDFDKDGNSVNRNANNYSKHGNDINWYLAYPELVNNVAKFDFTSRLGSTITMNDGYGDYTLETPGIFAMDVLPTYGIAGSADTSMNRVADMIYSNIRRKVANRLTYESADLMQYLVCVDSLLYMLEHFKRIYGVASSYNYNNKYYPRVILQAMSVDPDDVLMHLHDFKAAINSLVGALYAFPIPYQVMPITKRHEFIFSKIWLDRPLGKASSYVMSPSGYYYYSEEAQTAVYYAYTKYSPQTCTDDRQYAVPNGLNTVQDLIRILNTCIGALIASDTVDQIAGNLRSAYEGYLYQPAPMPDNYVVIPEYDPIALMQINNATINYDISTTNPPSVKQVVNSSQFRTYLSQTVYTQALDFNENVHPKILTNDKATFLLNIPSETPSVEDVVYATRLTTDLGIWDDTAKSLKLTAYGSEVVVNGKFFVTGEVSPTSGFPNVTWVWYCNNQLRNSSSTTFVNVHSLWTKYIPQFNGFPMFKETRYLNSGSSAGSTVYANLMNWSVQSIPKLVELHNAVVSSEFGLPYTVLV